MCVGGIEGATIVLTALSYQRSPSFTCPEKILVHNPSFLGRMKEVDRTPVGISPLSSTRTQVRGGR